MRSGQSGQLGQLKKSTGSGQELNLITWIGTIFALLVVSTDYMGAGVDLAIGTYKLAAFVYFIIYCLILNLSYNEAAMTQLMKSIIPTEASRRYLQDKMSSPSISRYLSIPLIIHMLAGIYFIWRISDIYLIVAYIFFMYYFRAIYLLLAASTVEYLNTLDNIDEFMSGGEGDDGEEA